MKKLLIGLVLTGLMATSVGAQARGYYRGGYHSGGYHSGTAFFFGAALGAALAYPFYYSRTWDDPGPYYYSPYYAPRTVYVNPPAYVVQTQPVYVQSQTGNAAVQPPSNGVIELGPVNALPPLNANLPPAAEAGRAAGDQWFVYPSRGQNQQQAANDRYDCGKWATSQSGYDPDLKVHRDPEAGPQNYGRALSACLEGRGYTVR
ncbi:MAG: hypothetical protein ABI648_02835 [Betaproteobacteria bacterium]|jgi:hypothetical protein